MVVFNGKGGGYSQTPDLCCTVSFADLHGARTEMYAGTDDMALLRLC